MSDSQHRSNFVSRLAYTSALLIWSGVLFGTALVLHTILIRGAVSSLPIQAGLFLITVAFAGNLLATALYRWSQVESISHSKQSGMMIITLLSPGLLAMVVFPPVSVAFAVFQGVLFLVMALSVLSWDSVSSVQAETVSDSETETVSVSEEEQSLESNDNDSQSDMPITLAFPEPGNDDSTQEWDEEMPSMEQGKLIHWMQRFELEDGDESLEGTMRVKFDAKHKMTTAHLPFVPPFPITPKVHCEVIDEAGARVKVAAVHPYGARIEVRRTGDVSQESELMIQIAALAGVSAKRVA